MSKSINQQLQTKAFSLAELLVTLAILSILSIMSVSSYSKYTNSARMAIAVTVLEALNKEAIERFNQGSLGSSFIYADTTLTTANTSYDHFPVMTVNFYGPGDASVGNDNEEWMFCVQVAGLRFDNYVPPAALGAVGSYSRLCHKIAREQEHFVHYCGRWDTGTTDIPSEHLITGCNCNSISSKTC